MFYRLKIGASQLTTHEIRNSQWKITSIVNFFCKSMNFCIVLPHYLANDISYDAKLNWSKNCYLLR